MTNNRVTPQFYSQNGEDCLLWEFFDNENPTGFFVEVGALDGIRFSNSYSFEGEGWRGICIEAHPTYFDLLKKNRSRSTNVFAAVSDENGETTFYTNSRGSLSTLNPSLEAEFREQYGNYFTGFIPVEVPMKTLTSILEATNAPQKIDFISIDIEGAEMLAISGLNFDKYRPRILIVEANSKDEEEALVTYLDKYGYLPARKIVNNVFFCNNKLDKVKLAKIDVDCYVKHMPHILDEGAEEVVKHIVINLLELKNFWNRLRSLLRRIRRFLRL